MGASAADLAPQSRTRRSGRFNRWDACRRLEPLLRLLKRPPDRVRGGPGSRLHPLVFQPLAVGPRPPRGLAVQASVAPECKLFRRCLRNPGDTSRAGVPRVGTRWTRETGRRVHGGQDDGISMRPRRRVLNTHFQRRKTPPLSKLSGTIPPADRSLSDVQKTHRPRRSPLSRALRSSFSAERG